MTGQIFHDARRKGIQLPSHPALSFRLVPTGTLHYCDIRRFGRWLRMSPDEWDQESRRLGPEPLDPDLSDHIFFKRTSASRSPIRSWLLEQTHLAGIGNIYANEALFRAQIHPFRPARSMSEEESADLLAAIREVLREAIEARGTTLRDYRTAEGDRGSFEPRLQIYGREGLPCPRCGAEVVRIVFANRSAFHCPVCQKEKPPYAS
jgi:formamidopyrimidine-DNA glycosylase